MKFWHIKHKTTGHEEIISDDEWNFVKNKKPSWARQYIVKPATQEQVTTFIPPEVLDATAPTPERRVRVEFELPKKAPEPAAPTEEPPAEKNVKFAASEAADATIGGEPVSEPENDPPLRRRKRRHQPDKS